MHEPYRSQFIELVRMGAASRDIHDSDGLGSYDSAAGSTVASDRFIAREVGRVDMHASSLCVPLAERLGRARRILDVGCGTGGTTVALVLSRLEPEEVVGVDISVQALEAGEVRAMGYGLAPGRVRFELVEAGRRLPFADASFDLVTCVSVLEFITSDDRRGALISEMLRVLRPGGHLYLATPNPLRLREYHSRRWLGDLRRSPGYPWSSSPTALRRMLRGCEVISLAPDRIRRHPRLRRLGWAAPALAWVLPWQRLLARKPDG